MKANHLAFTIISLIFCGIMIISLLSMIFVVIPGVPQENRGIFHFMIALQSIASAMLAIGGISNLSKSGFASWPTGLIIVGYVSTIWLVPFAVWGLVSFFIERTSQNKQNKALETAN